MRWRLANTGRQSTSRLRANPAGGRGREQMKSLPTRERDVIAAYGKIKRRCLICQKYFYVHPNVIKRGRGKYCSMECYPVRQRSAFCVKHPKRKSIARSLCMYCYRKYLLKTNSEYDKNQRELQIKYRLINKESKKEYNKKYQKQFYNKHKKAVIKKTSSWRKNNIDKFRAIARKSARKRRLRLLGFSEDEYGKLLKESNGNCAICKKQSTKLNLDHHHQSNTVRGLLCTQCNFMIGFSKDSIDILKQAINYLEFHNKRIAPK